MTIVKLKSADGVKLKEARLPSIQPPPKVLIVGEHVFVQREDGDYWQTYGYRVPKEHVIY